MFVKDTTVKTATPTKYLLLYTLNILKHAWNIYKWMAILKSMHVARRLVNANVLDRDLFTLKREGAVSNLFEAWNRCYLQ